MGDSETERERLGRVVRAAWVDHCRRTGDDKPSHLAPWEMLSDWDQEADRCIADAVRAAILPAETVAVDAGRLDWLEVVAHGVGLLLDAMEAAPAFGVDAIDPIAPRDKLRRLLAPPDGGLGAGGEGAGE